MQGNAILYDTLHVVVGHSLLLVADFPVVVVGDLMLIVGHRCCRRLVVEQLFISRYRLSIIILFWRPCSSGLMSGIL
jgi:hypothetical protein